MRDRDYKLFRSGYFYHIFNRGNNKQKIFLESSDFLNFLKRFKIVLGIPVVGKTSIRPLPKDAFSIVSYCLMPNHFHMCVRQNTDIGIDKLILKLCTSYAIYFNHKYEHVGNVFQDAFKAKLVENDRYAQYLSTYIHNNPGNLDYDYSSYKDIIGLRPGQIVDTSIVLSWFNNDPEKYAEFVKGFSEKDKGLVKNLLFEE